MEKELEFIEIVPKTINNIFIVLHGYGVDYNDLFGLGMNFRDLLPNTAFIFVNAPFECEAGSGYQWFSLRKMNLFSILKEIKISNRLLNSFIDKQLKRFSLEDKNLFLCGFSQGAILSMYTGIRRQKSPFAVLSFSGMMTETIETLKRELRSKPKILLIHGTADVVVPYNNLERTEDLLREFDINFESHSIDGMPHAINDEAIIYAREFIKKLCNNN